MRPGDVIIAASIPVIFIAGCGNDHRPLGPEIQEPAFVVEPNGGCVPEVITTNQDSTETLLFTFTMPDGCLYPPDSPDRVGLIDGSSYGVDFGNPQGDETGTVAYYAEENDRYQNMPSPLTVAKAYDSGVYTSFIEFGPAVRTVSFFYSKWHDGPAWWGGQLVEADSMRVYALDSNFFIVDYLTLYGNVQRHMETTWDQVELKTSSDRIAWLRFEGMIWIDDLEITRGLPPEIECTSSPGNQPTIERGQQAICKITRSVDSVTGWRFQAPADSILVSSSSSDTTWSGMAVLSGFASASVMKDGIADTLRGTLEVSDRTGSDWRWGPSDWDFQAHAGLDCGYYSDVVVPDLYSGVFLAFNTRLASCASGSIDPNVVDPSYPIDIDSGYDAAQVPAGGPNAGLWYVTAAQYRMDRGSSRNPYLNSGYTPRVDLTGRADLRECRNAFDLGKNDPVSVNWYEYNAFCRGIALEGSGGMFEGIWNHEEYGRPPRVSSDSNGHQGRREWIAGQPENDPYRLIERLIDIDEARLRTDVKNRVEEADELISSFAGDHNFVKNNWSGQVWVLDEGDGEFQKETFAF